MIASLCAYFIWGKDDIFFYDLWGIIGGIFVELAWWHARAKNIRKALAEIKGLLGYFVVRSFVILGGGVLVHGHQMTAAHMHPTSANQFTIFLAFNIGAATPLFIAGLRSDKRPG